MNFDAEIIHQLGRIADAIEKIEEGPAPIISTDDAIAKLEALEALVQRAERAAAIAQECADIAEARAGITQPRKTGRYHD